MIHDMLLVEKYRPQTLGGIIGGQQIEQLQKALKEDPWSLPNLLLSSRSAGTGKTSMAMAIIRQMNADSLFLNASDDRGINTIRDRVKEFAMTQGFSREAPKIVHFDEADGLTREAQESLRSIMEQYSSNCRFIFTCNNDAKIIEPIKSRCVIINLNEPPREKIFNHLKIIATAEEMGIKDDTLLEIVDMFYPDIRSMINALDASRILGIDKVVNPRSVFEDVYSLLKQSKVTDARKLWIAKSANPRILVKELYRLVMADEKLTKDQITSAVEYIAEADFRIAMGSDAEITLANLAIQLASSAFK
jgi:replication factor C small subunit